MREGSHHTEEAKALIGASRLGKKHTPETIAKIAKTSRGRKLTPEHIAKLGSKKGVPKSPEHRKAISEAIKEYHRKRREANDE